MADISSPTDLAAAVAFISYQRENSQKLKYRGHSQTPLFRLLSAPWIILLQSCGSLVVAIRLTATFTRLRGLQTMNYPVFPTRQTRCAGVRRHPLRRCHHAAASIVAHLPYLAPRGLERVYTMTFIGENLSLQGMSVKSNPSPHVLNSSVAKSFPSLSPRARRMANRQHLRWSCHQHQLTFSHILSLSMGHKVCRSGTVPAFRRQPGNQSYLFFISANTALCPFLKNIVASGLWHSRLLTISHPSRCHCYIRYLRAISVRGPPKLPVRAA
eukprot:g9787.t1